MHFDLRYEYIHQYICINVSFASDWGSFVSIFLVLDILLRTFKCVNVFSLYFNYEILWYYSVHIIWEEEGKNVCCITSNKYTPYRPSNGSRVLFFHQPLTCSHIHQIELSQFQMTILFARLCSMGSETGCDGFG